jgi:hypothetical protein
VRIKTPGHLFTFYHNFFSSLMTMLMILKEVNEHLLSIEYSSTRQKVPTSLIKSVINIIVLYIFLNIAMHLRTSTFNEKYVCLINRIYSCFFNLELYTEIRRIIQINNPFPF